MARRLLKSTVFFIAFLFLFSKATDLVTTIDNIAYRDQKRISGFYDEQKDLLDAVYIGASNVYSLWMAPYAWEKYGIAVYPYSVAMEPLEATKYIIEEVRKTQPNALYIIALNAYSVQGVETSVTDAIIHRITDFFPLSSTKLGMIHTLADSIDEGQMEQMEFIAPFIRYHDRWDELRIEDFHQDKDNLKGRTYRAFYVSTTDVTASYRSTSARDELLPRGAEVLDDLLEYCETEDLNVLFTTSPQAIDNEQDIARLNTMLDICREHGFPTLDMLGELKNMGMELARDYYNAFHTNIHGALKVTDYLSQYLVDNYEFRDKRGEAGYSSWDEAAVEYAKIASAHVLDVEWEGLPRNKSQNAPSIEVAVDGTTLCVSWSALQGASGYRVYRQTSIPNEDGWIDAENRTPWELVTTTGSDVLEYRDPDREIGKDYYYTVIGYWDVDGEKQWGYYKYLGVGGTALMDAPNLVGLSGEEDDLTITWKATAGADGYKVFRSLPQKNWIEIADVSQLSYTDTQMLSGVPYQYTVKPYYFDEESPVIGSFDTDGLLWIPPSGEDGFQITNAIENGMVRLSWERVEGANGYTVQRRTPDGQWQQLCTDLLENSTGFVDLVAHGDTNYEYKVSAYVKYKGEKEELATASVQAKAETSVNNTKMPKVTTLEQVEEHVCLSWEKTDGAAAYRIYRRAASEDDWKLIQDNVKNDYYIDNPGLTSEYEYLVQVLFSKDGITFFGDFLESSASSISFQAP